MDSSETVKIVPDMAKIVFAVTSEAKKADECQQKNTEALNSLTEYLKGRGSTKIDHDIRVQPESAV